MTQVPETQQDWNEWAADRLADAGYRRGGARRELLELMGGQPCALSAFEIEDRLAAGPRRVSRASIYRILEELEETRLGPRVEGAAGTPRYEPIRSGHDHHHHLVCDRCGRLEPFTDAALEAAVAQASQRVDLNVSEHEN